MLTTRDIEWNTTFYGEENPEEAIQVLKNVRSLTEESQVVAFDFETGHRGGEENGINPLQDTMISVSFCSNEDATGAIRIGDDCDPNVYAELKSLFNWLYDRRDISKVIQNLKFDAKLVWRIIGKCPEVNDTSWEDTMVMMYMLDENKSAGLKKGASRHLNIDGSKYERRINEMGKISKLLEMDWRTSYQYNCADSWMTLKLFKILPGLLIESDLDTLYNRMYKALLLVLLETEILGFQVDKPYLEQKKQEYTERIEGMRQGMNSLARSDFNPRSVPQLRQILTNMGLTQYIADRKTKTGVSTDYDSLVKLSRIDTTGFIETLLKFREEDKTRTIIEGLLDRLDGQGVVRSNFLPNGTRTGRLCVDGDTLLETSNGVFKISELDLTQYPECAIITHKHRPRKILQKIYKGTEDMYVIKTREKKSITCTKGHRFFTRRGWVHLQDLQIGSSVFTLRGKDFGMSISKWSGVCDSFSRDYNRIDSLQDEIISIEYAGIRGVWDIEVEEDHSYIAQGFINHNSSRDPNLENLPKGPEIRQAFVARPGKRLVIGDYSQIELRLAAWYANDDVMLDIFKRGGDIHSSTAIIAYDLNCEESEIKILYNDKRDKSKNINFGILYGLSDKNLAILLGCTQEEATAIRRKIFSKYDDILTYKKEVEDFVVKNEYVVNAFGRRRRFPGLRELYKRNGARDMEVGFQLREAFNSIIQGSGADITNLGVSHIKIRTVMEGIEVVLLNQVHDETIWEVWEGDVPKFIKIMHEEGENILAGYPIPLEISVVSSWGERYLKNKK